MKELNLLNLRGYMASWVMFAMTRKDDKCWNYTDQLYRVRSSIINGLAIHIRKKSRLRSYRNRNLFRLEMLNALITTTFDRIFRIDYTIDVTHLTLCNAIDNYMEGIIVYLRKGGDPNLLHDTTSVTPLDVAVKELNDSFRKELKGVLENGKM
jgi:hypothetical protein